MIDSNSGLRLSKSFKQQGGRITPMTNPIDTSSSQPAVRTAKATVHRAKIVSADERTRSVKLRLNQDGGYHHKSSSRHYRNSFLRIANTGANGAAGGRLTHVADADQDDALDLVASVDDEKTWSKIAEGVLTSVHFNVKPASTGSGMIPVSAAFSDSAMDESTSKWMKLQKRDGSTERVTFKPRFAHAVGNLTKSGFDPFKAIHRAGPSNLMKIAGPRIPTEPSAQVDTFKKIHRAGPRRGF